MINAAHTFSLADLFNTKISHESMRKLLSAYGGTITPLQVKVTMGDVAMCLGAPYALWCSRIMSESTRKDVIKSILPSIKRRIHRLKAQDQFAFVKDDGWRITKAVDLIESFVNNEGVSLRDLRGSVVECTVFYPRDSFGHMIANVAAATFEEDYHYCINQAAVMRENLPHVPDPEFPYIDLDEERKTQVLDIILVFKPIVGVKEPSH